MITIQKLLNTGLIALSLLVPITSYSQSDCDDALNAATRAIKNQNELIGMQSDQIEALRFDAVALKSQLNNEHAWYKSPSFLIPLSFIAGAVTISHIGR